MFDSWVGYWGVAISVDRCPTILGNGQAWKLCQYIFIFFSSFPFSDKVQVLFVKLFFNSQRLLCSLHLTQLKILYQVNGELFVNIHKWRIYLQKMNVVVCRGSKHLWPRIQPRILSFEVNWTYQSLISNFWGLLHLENHAFHYIICPCIYLQRLSIFNSFLIAFPCCSSTLYLNNEDPYYGNLLPLLCLSKPSPGAFLNVLNWWELLLQMGSLNFLLSWTVDIAPSLEGLPYFIDHTYIFYFCALLHICLYCELQHGILLYSIRFTIFKEM